MDKGLYMTVYSNWTMGDELKFIDGLGGWRPEYRNENKCLLYENYIKSLDIRKDFGLLNKKRLKKYAEAILESISQ